MPNQIDGDVKEQRSKKLIELSDSNELEFNKSYIGRDVEMLFEEVEDGYMKGHTTNYMNVKCKCIDKSYVNQIKKVKVIDADKENLVAQM